MGNVDSVTYGYLVGLLFLLLTVTPVDVYDVCLTFERLVGRYVVSIYRFVRCLLRTCCGIAGLRLPLQPRPLRCAVDSPTDVYIYRIYYITLDVLPLIYPFDCWFIPGRFTTR